MWIAANERREIPITPRVPDQAQPGDRVGGNITSLAPKKGGGPTVSVDRRAATQP